MDENVGEEMYNIDYYDKIRCKGNKIARKN